MNDDIRDSLPAVLPPAEGDGVATAACNLGPEYFWNGSEKMTVCSRFREFYVGQVIDLSSLLVRAAKLRGQIHHPWR
ncbi:hypothetical protein [Pseudomonas sp. KB-10]|jgi:hypothetical protein|uniref:hypothetical protein n=1 Tax=Pseudomonas sp. KB-10 TaxID=2292264 RepID=UPI001BB053C2|nr:hypothetical protein [Pseudomonas sp. KB-10]